MSLTNVIARRPEADEAISERRLLRQRFGRCLAMTE